jgi:hypothetical protein
MTFTFSHFNKLFCVIKFTYQLRRRNIGHPLHITRRIAFFTIIGSQLVSVRNTVKTVPARGFTTAEQSFMKWASR